MVLLLTIYYLASQGTWALPIQDTGKSTQSHHDLGDDRTIWNIIWSCVVIVFSCTWLAIHPNIPSQEEGKGWRALRRVGMFISAVIMPELMILWAMRQRWIAHELEKKYKNFNWTPTHGFFAMMGGFMLYKGHTPQYVLEPWDLEPYLKSGQIDITEDEIRDKSKGDILTKGFVVLQTTWFITQLIARGTERLSITELEVATLAFASLNFVTYGMWWNKPLNVESPIRVYSSTSNHSSGEGEIGDENADSETFNPVGNTSSGKNFSEGGDRNGITDRQKQPSKFFNILKNIQDAFQPPVDNFPSKLWHKDNKNSWFLFPFYLMAAPGRDPKLKRGAKRVPTFYSGRLDDVIKDVSTIFLIAVTLVTVLFGGIHCIAWTFHFPTHTEQLIWRVSSIYITAAPMAAYVIATVGNGAQLFFRLSDSKFSLFFGIPAVITMILYPVARLVLLVQALMTLRSLPPEAYTTVQWTTFIPHI